MSLGRSSGVLIFRVRSKAFNSFAFSFQRSGSIAAGQPDRFLVRKGINAVIQHDAFRTGGWGKGRDKEQGARDTIFIGKK
jgi:hypothetical protein